MRTCLVSVISACASAFSSVFVLTPVFNRRKIHHFLLVAGLLVLVSALCRPSSAIAQDAAPELEVPAPSPYNNEGTRSIGVLFAGFSDDAAGPPPVWSTGLLDRARPGTLPHFYREMSFGRLEVDGQVASRRYRSLQPSVAYLASNDTSLGLVGRFSTEILRQADRDMDFSLFDNDGPDGVADSGDDDGKVDALFLIVARAPQRFLLGGATGLASLGLEEDFLTDDIGVDGRQIRIESRRGVVMQGRGFAETAAVMCHEYGHLLGLPDLFNTTFLRQGKTNPAEDSAGIGAWGVMGWGTLGWNGDDGPNALSAWSRQSLGWARVEEIRVSGPLTVEDVGQRGTVYKVPLTVREYFLLEYRRRGSSFYDRNLPGEGLLVWHVENLFDKDTGQGRLSVDLECADGRWLDAGFPQGIVPDAGRGGDNLNFWAHDAAYSTAHNGNLGDATDPFDGIGLTAFTPGTNPSSFSNDATRSISLEDIRAEGDVLRMEVLTVPLLVEFSRGFLADASGDGVLVAGEVGRPLFRIFNQGTQNLAEVRISMTTADTLVEILQEETVFRNIRPGRRSEGSGVAGFPRLRLSQSFTGGHTSEIVLSAYVGEALASERVVPFTAQSHNQPVAAIVVVDTAGNGDGRVQPGEIFRLELAVQSEARVMEQFDLVLRSLDPHLRALPSDSIRIEAEKDGGVRVVSPDFLLDASADADAALAVEFRLESEYGAWADTLVLPVGAGHDATSSGFYLGANFPNPFNLDTAISYGVSGETLVEITLYNVLGQPVRQLVRARQTAGSYRVSWDGRDDLGRALGSGVYFYRLRADGRLLTRRMLMIN